VEKLPAFGVFAPELLARRAVGLKFHQSLHAAALQHRDTVVDLLLPLLRIHRPDAARGHRHAQAHLWVLEHEAQRNRSAAVRIPAYSRSEKSKRIEVRFPDPSCNGYLAFSALLMAGLDGIQNKIKPIGPLDKDLYDLEPEDLAKVPKAPGGLDEVLDALQKDHAFLLKGDVFTQDVIDVWIDYKRKKEVDAIRLRPHPWEFALYYDISPDSGLTA